MDIPTETQGIDVKVPFKKRMGLLPIALAVAIGLSITLTAVSVSIYYLGGFSTFDLSRPELANERGEIVKPQPIKTYDTTSPITAKAIEEFLTEFDARSKDLKAYDTFKSESLSDSHLQLKGIRGN